jgi:predicted ribosome quality control (RQC) complex YloA/Tae2 family protein
MPLDAICLSAVLAELKPRLTGGKVDKIYQPSRDEIVLNLRSAGKNMRLLLSGNPSQPRLHLTDLPRENPAQPPMFCMLLRKHLTGGRILSVIQPPLERTVRLSMEVIDEMGDRVPRALVLEALGRRANVILLDADNRIVDCMRRVDADMSAQRQILPGLFYRQPPAQDRVDPFTGDRTSLERMMARVPAGTPADKWLLSTFTGLSPLICRELAFRALGTADARLEGGAGSDRLLDELEKLHETVEGKNFVPYMLLRDGRPVDFTFLPILQYGPGTESVPQPSFSAMLDTFYATRETAERAGQRGQELFRSVTRLRDRTARRVAQQRRELESTRDRERKRELGDIITSNLHTMVQGMTSLHATDYYDPEERETDIPLDPLLTPQQNAAKYYKAYNKAKTAQQVLTDQIQKGGAELDYLESVLEAIPLAEGERDILEIRQELVQTGYLRRSGKGKGAARMKVSAKPMEFRSSSGLRITVGKNNTQNDLLTTRLAGKGDLWFHTQKIHGSHVILWTEGSQPDVQSIEEAASLAAWFSQARGGKKVPVDYTPVRYVKKPAGAKPGMVIYTTYQTALADPDGELAKRLRTK